MLRLPSGATLGVVLIFLATGCSTQSGYRQRTAAFMQPMRQGEVSVTEFPIRAPIPEAETSKLLASKGSNVQVVYGLRREVKEKEWRDVRVVVGAPSPSSTEVTGVGSIERAGAVDWSGGRLELVSGAALAAMTPELPDAREGREPAVKTKGKLDVPVQPVIVLEDLETGADGTAWLVWATDDDSTADASDRLAHVALLSGGPLWILLPDEDGDGDDDKEPKRVLLSETKTVLQVHISGPVGARIYTVRNAGEDKTYNDGEAGPADPLELEGRGLDEFPDFFVIVERMSAVTRALELR